MPRRWPISNIGYDTEPPHRSDRTKSVSSALPVALSPERLTLPSFYLPSPSQLLYLRSACPIWSPITRTVQVIAIPSRQLFSGMKAVHQASKGVQPRLGEGAASEHHLLTRLPATSAYDAFNPLTAEESALLLEDARHCHNRLTTVRDAGGRQITRSVPLKDARPLAAALALCAGRCISYSGKPAPREAAILLGMQGSELTHAATHVMMWHGKLLKLRDEVARQAAKRAPDEKSCKVEATTCKFAKAEVGEEPSQPSPRPWQQPSSQPQPSQAQPSPTTIACGPSALPAQPAWIPASLHARLRAGRAR